MVSTWNRQKNCNRRAGTASSTRLALRLLWRGSVADTTLLVQQTERSCGAYMVEQRYRKIVPRIIPRIIIFLRQTFTVLLACFFFGCAGQVAPSGGPPDTVPPEVIRTVPGQGSLNVRDGVVLLEFSEYVDKRSVESALFVSPDAGELTFDWGSTDVEVRFGAELRESTTYVVSLGTDVVDLRNKNRLAKAFSLAFSTGDRIDSGSIQGMVVDPKPSGVMIFGYRHAGRDIDTLNPSRTKPDVVTQTGKDGSFVLPYLAYGRYRIIAMRDEFKNLLYDAETDQFGVPSHEVDVGRERKDARGLAIRLTVEDTSRPFLSQFRAVDRIHALIRFSEPIDPASLERGNIRILDTAQRILPVRGITMVTGRSDEFMLETGTQDGGLAYTIDVGAVHDLQRHPLAADTVKPTTQGSSEPDTTKPMIAFRTMRDTLLTPFPWDTLVVRFSEPVVRPMAEHAITLTDTGKTLVPVSRSWLDDGAVSILPVQSLTFGTPYRIVVDLDSVRDGGNVRAGDSVVVRKFVTIDSGILGSIRGRCADGDSSGVGPVYIVAQPVSTKQVRPYTIVLGGPGEFAFDQLPEGKYTVYAYRDADRSGGYSFGSLYPYAGSERWSMFPETLKVRARWPVEGVNLFLR